MVSRLNSIQIQGRYQKEKLVKKEMTKMLTENPNGIDSEEFVKKITEATGASRGMVYDRIRDFQTVGNIRIDRPKHDRRKAIYFPNNIPKLEAQNRRYHVEEFLGNMNPSNSHEDIRLENNMQITFSLFAEGKGKPKWPEDTLKLAFQGFQPLGEAYMKGKKGLDKFAIFVGFEKKE
jgi:hypothetical protein